MRYFGERPYLELVLAGLGLRCRVEEIDGENLQSRSKLAIRQSDDVLFLAAATR